MEDALEKAERLIFTFGKELALKVVYEVIEELSDTLYETSNNLVWWKSVEIEIKRITS